MARETRETDARKTGREKRLTTKCKERRTVKDMKEQEETAHFLTKRRCGMENKIPGKCWVLSLRGLRYLLFNPLFTRLCYLRFLLFMVFLWTSMPEDLLLRSAVP